MRFRLTAALLAPLLLLAGCAPAPTSGGGGKPMARVTVALDQVGYLPAAAKVATVASAPGDKGVVPAEFAVIRADTGEQVLRGTLTGPTTEPEASGGETWLADFSTVRAEGAYKLIIQGSGESPVFRVGSQAYGDLFAKALRSYFLQRCGVALDDPVTGLKHAACHVSPSVLEADRSVKLDTAGGWHDAGDYGRYMPTAALTAGQLLMLAEFVPKAAMVQLSGTDLLSEVRFELDWMLKMQRSDGAVYHKVTTENFPGFILPEQDTAPLLVYPVGTHSTALFAAATARGARTYKAADPAYADRLAAAAAKAWGWLAAHPDLINPPVGNTGPYLPGSDKGARLWAAAELFALTGDPVYERYLAGRLPGGVAAPNWENPADLAWLTYAFTPAANPTARGHAEAVILKQADYWAGKAGDHPYGVALGADQYEWGSAKTTQAIAMHLLLANRLRPDPAYVRAAEAQLHWVLGRNPLGRSFVTGVGTFPPLHPHHRLAAATGKVVPGLLVGGPNDRGQDKAVPPGLGPRSYADGQDSYSSNEPAIDYNAPLVFVAGWLSYGGDVR